MTSNLNFIDFALSLYAQPSVQAECLQLQDAKQVSIPLLLCCAWLDYCDVGANLASLTDQTPAALAWEQAVVWPLRTLRRQLKPAAQGDASTADIRSKIKQVELSAEMEVLRRLGSIPWVKCSEQALTSLRKYYQLPDECDSFSALRARMAELQANTLTGQTN